MELLAAQEQVEVAVYQELLVQVEQAVHRVVQVQVELQGAQEQVEVVVHPALQD
jgi:hypothetical protein